MRVGIVSLMQESNTFACAPTTLAHFEQDTLAAGEAVRTAFEGSHHEIGGFLRELDASSIEAVPIFAARALPYGVIEADSFDRLLSRLLDVLDAAGPLDGVLAAAHGATVSESFPDADGHWLGQLRRAVGPRVPIVATIDPHANLSRAMVRATDALIAYRTNPHTDQLDRGIEAARLMTRILAGEVRPVQAAAFPPMAINIECQETAVFPCRAWIEQADALRDRREVLSVSPILGFPYADVEEMGSAALVVTDGDPAQAQQLADDLAAFAWEHRDDFRGEFIEIDEALDEAASSTDRVLLLDMGDNLGGGGPGDGTAIAQELERRAIGRSFVCLCDPEAVDAAARTGVGGRVELAMGGKADPESGGPLRAGCHVLGLYDGRFDEPDPRHGAFATFDQGRVAVVRTERDLTVMLTSRRVPPWSLRQLTSCGLDPAAFRVIVAKGVVAPLAAYGSICPRRIRVNSPGVTCADMTRLAYRHRRQPMFPFEPDTVWPR